MRANIEKLAEASKPDQGEVSKNVPCGKKLSAFDIRANPKAASDNAVPYGPNVILIAGPREVGKAEVVCLIARENHAGIIKKHTIGNLSNEESFVDKNQFYIQIKEDAFEKMVKNESFRFVQKNADGQVGISNGSLQDAWSDRSRFSMILASGYASFKDYVRFFSRGYELRPGMRPGLISVLLYSPGQSLEEKLADEPLVTKDKLREYKEELRHFSRHAAEFKYIIKHKSPFGRYLQKDMNRGDHELQINFTARMLYEAIKWEDILDTEGISNSHHSTRVVHSKYVERIVHRLFGVPPVDLANKIQTQKVYLNFAENVVQVYANSLGIVDSVVPREAPVLGFKRSYGIWSIFLDGNTKPSEREMILDLIARKSEARYAEREKQDFVSDTNITKLGRCRVNGSAHEGGLFTLWNWEYAKKGADSYGVNACFVSDVASEKLMSERISPTKLARLGESGSYP